MAKLLVESVFILSREVVSNVFNNQTASLYYVIKSLLAFALTS